MNKKYSEIDSQYVDSTGTSGSTVSDTEMEVGNEERDLNIADITAQTIGDEHYKSDPESSVIELENYDISEPQKVTITVKIEKYERDST